MSILQIELLGDFHIRYEGEPLTGFHQNRRQSLLAYLTLHRHRPQSRRRLAFLFWPESTEQQAHNNLRKAIYLLRSALPNDKLFLYVDTTVVQWLPDAPCALDVARFEHHLAEAERAGKDGELSRQHLQSAVDLYAEDLLPDCYDDWIAPVREQLRTRYLEALARLAAHLEQTRAYAAAIRQATRLLRADPLREETYRRLMRLHALKGDRAGALRVYFSCAATLQRELGVEPSLPTQESYAQLLHLGTEQRTPRVPQGKGRRNRLVGRRAAWRRLMAAWDHALRSHAQFVLISGEAGIGKTRLAEEMLIWARRQGITQARTRAYAAEGSLAYAPVIELLRAETFGVAKEQLDDVWRSEVARVLPEFLVERPDLLRPEPLTERWQQTRLFEAMARTILAAGQPLLLLIDDLQWCDPETLQWLHYLLRFKPAARWLVLGNVRLEEMAEARALQALCYDLRSSDQLIEIELGLLDAEQTATLAAQLTEQTITPADQQALYQATAGNPLFITETMHAAMRGSDEVLVGTEESFVQIGDHAVALPPKVQAVIRARLMQLSPGARELAHLVAVIGRAFTFELLVQASGVDEDGIVHALDELWRRRIVREQENDSFDVSHDVIRAVAYSESSPVRRQQFHRQVAQALEQLHAADVNRVSAQIAIHYRQAGDAAKAAEYYCRAAHEMQFGFAYAEMIDHLQQGLAMLQHQSHIEENIKLEIALYLALGRVLTAQSGWGSDSVVEVYETARRLCLEANDLPQLVRVQDYLQVAYGDNGNFASALELGASNLALAIELADSAATESAHGGLGLFLWVTGDFVAARTHLEQAAALAAQAAEREAAEPSASTAHAFRAGVHDFPTHAFRAGVHEYRALSYPGAFPHALVLWLLGYPETAHKLLQRVVAAQAQHDRPFDRMTACEFCVMFHYWRRDWKKMLASARKFLALIDAYEYPSYSQVGSIYAAAASAALGLPHADTDLMRQNIEGVKATGVRMYEPFLWQLLAETHARHGQYSVALAALEESLRTIAETGERSWEAETYRLRGTFLEVAGRHQEAELAYQQALARAQTQQAKALELRAATSLARLWQAQGRSAEARPILAEIYGWFTEGFDSSALTQAQALLTT